MNPFNIFRRAAPQGTVTPGSSVMMLGLFGGADRRVTRREQLEAYTGWTYAATTIIADDVQRSPYRVVNVDAKGNSKEAPQSALSRLLKNFVGMTPAEAKLLTSLHLDLTGEAFWLVITQGGTSGARPIGLQVLNPDWLEVDTTRDGTTVSTWRVSVAGFESRVVGAEDVIHFRMPNPLGGARGFSPVRAFALSHDTNLYARAYTADLLKNRARPDGILKSEQELNRDQAEIIKARWQQQVTTGEVAVLGKGSSYQPISSSIRDLEFMALAQLTREDVLAIYRLPASKLGLDTSRSQADAEQSNIHYERNVLSPRLARYDDTINHYLAPRVGKELLEHEDPVGDDREAKRSEALALWGMGLMTADEARTYLDWDALPAGEGTMRMVPNTHRIVAKLEPTPASQGASTQTNEGQQV